MILHILQYTNVKTTNPLFLSPALMLLLPLVLLQACGSGQPMDWKPDPMVDTKQHIEDSIYRIYGDSFLLFMERVEEATHQPTLKNYSLEVSDSAEVAWAYYALNFIDSMPHDSLGLTYKNCLLLFNKQNLYSFRRPSKERSFGLDQQYSLMQFTSLLRYEGKIASTHEINVDTWIGDSTETDSITKSYKKDFIKRKMRSLETMREARYLLVVEDMCLKKPRMISKDGYESGLLVSDTKLIRITDKQIVAKRTFLIENSKEMSHIEQSINVGMNLVNGSNSILETDLIKRRNRELVEFYNIH